MGGHRLPSRSSSGRESVSLPDAAMHPAAQGRNRRMSAMHHLPGLDKSADPVTAYRQKASWSLDSRLTRKRITKMVERPAGPATAASSFTRSWGRPPNTYPTNGRR